MTSFLSILAKSSGAIDQNLAVDKGNAGDVLISTTTGFSFVSPNTFTPNLSQVLLAGNTATNSINLNNIGVGTNVISLLPNVGVADPQITLTDGTTTNTINKSGYTTRNSVQNITHYLNFSDSSATGTGAIQKSTGIECNPSTKTITTTTFIGNLTGTASNATTATTATNITTTSDNTSGTYFIPFSKTAAGVSTQIFLDDTTTALTYNPSTSNLTATTFTGNLTGTASNATSATTATTATNIAGGSGGSIPYQSAASTTALLANGTAGQVLTSAGTTLAPTWSTAPQNTDGNWQFDDMWGGQNTNNGPFGMQQVGTPAVNSPQAQNASDGYNGIQRIWNTATNTTVGYGSGCFTWFRNMLTNSSKGFVMIFRPWPLGTATNTTLYVGFSNDFSLSTPVNQLAWQYSTNLAPTGQWSFRQDGASVYSSGYTTTGANQWHRMTLVRTGAATYTTTFQNLDTPSAIYSYSGTCSGTNLQLLMGGMVACVSGAASKYLDIDYIGNYFNSAH